MNNPKDAQIYIIGAGISGLIAAINLEKEGYKPVILEKDHHVGGRVQTDVIDGYQLDRGFQVLLEAYPKAQEYLDYQALELQPLSSGAMLFENGKGSLFGDPKREFRFLFPTLRSTAGSLTDKWKIYQLNQKLGKTDLESVFSRKETTTLDYLKEEGFSDQIIDTFFRPFYSGIYLESELATSSRMFEYVFKLFGEGRAMITKKGIGAIADQLAGQLKQTTIQFDTEVSKVTHDTIYLSNGENLPSDFTVIATNAESIVENYASSLKWKSCENLYFTMPRRSFPQAIIGLSSQKGTLINNIFFPTSVQTESKGENELLSVTVVKEHAFDKAHLLEEVLKELDSVFGIRTARYLTQYHIANALPDLADLQYDRDEGENLLTDRIAIAGDQHLNGSLNAAMISGERAASIAHRAVSNELIAL